VAVSIRPIRALPRSLQAQPQRQLLQQHPLLLQHLQPTKPLVRQTAASRRCVQRTHRCMKELLNRLQPALRFAERIHRELCRNRQRQVVVIAVLAVSAAAIYALSVAQLHRQRDAFGDYVLVHVATAEISAGQPVSPLNTRTFTMPTQFVLPSTRTSLPSSLTATSDISEGDIISLQNSLAEGEGASVPAGMRAVSIVPRIAMPALSSGTFVDIIANGQVITPRGIVLSSLENNVGVVVAVPELLAPAVASAASVGEATLVISN